MARIKQLAKEDILKIAAGEVICRPANVVKELVENAIDAGSKNITIKIWQAGKKRIIIEDDGCGMSEEDALLSVMPHATSKINSVDDLWQLNSFGFRGEALASISAVSKLCIVTAEVGLQEGQAFYFENTEFLKKEPVFRSHGTTIIVDELFYNLPVRQKFLKTNETESSSIWQTFLSLALVNKQISFKFFEDEKMLCNAAASDLFLDRVAQLFDFYIAKNLIPFSFNSEDFVIEGFTSNLQISRYNKNQMFLFVNNRSFRDPKICNSICNGYNGALPAQKFPVSFVDIKIKPHLLDVNVHPTKEEVLIQPHFKLVSSLKQAVNQALENHQIFSQIPTLDSLADQAESQILLEPAVSDHNQMQESAFAISAEVNSNSRRFEPIVEKNNPPAVNYFNFDEVLPTSLFTTQKEVVAQNNLEIFKNETIVSAEAPRVIGQIFQTYILFINQDKLCLLDQHGASERIIYEEMKSNFENLPQFKLITLWPIDFSAEQIFLLEQNQLILKKFGIGFKKVEGKLFLETLPPSFDPTLAQEMLESFLAKLQEDLDPSPELLRKKLFEHLHSHLACKTAIKAKSNLNFFVMQNLLNKLLQTPNKYQCIHGRPTIFEISKKELDKHFLRI